MTPSSPFLSRPGAVEAWAPDSGVSAHYGEPLREQRLLASGEALVDLSHFGVVSVTGIDRLTWLHSITTAHMESLEPGKTVETLVLSPQGRVEYAALLVDDGATTWMVTENDQAEGLTAWLDSMRFTRRVEVANVSRNFAAIGSVIGAEDGQFPVLDATSHVTLNDPWPHVVSGGTRYTTITESEHPGYATPWRVTLIPREQLETAVGTVPLAGMWAAEALRVAAWRPRFAREVDHRTLPHELDWLRTAVHLDKGCYRGQESVARVHNLGAPPRRLVFMHLDGSDHELPAPGSPVTLEVSAGRPVGMLTSSALHFELGPIALALIRRSTPLTAPLYVTTVSAAQEEIVGITGVSVDRPAARPPTARGVRPPKSLQGGPSSLRGMK